jgi:hypothetical protein
MGLHIIISKGYQVISAVLVFQFVTVLYMFGGIKPISAVPGYTPPLTYV